MQRTTPKTATVHLGHTSAYGEIIRQIGEYVTVRFGEGPKSIFTGRLVQAT